MPPPTSPAAISLNNSPLVCLHTVAPLIPTFDALLGEAQLGVPVFHLLDQLLLHSIANKLAPRETHLARLATHRHAAVAAGARVFFVTCSTLSPLLAELPPETQIETLAIDAPIGEAASRWPGKLSVLATNPAALAPCLQMLAHHGRAVDGAARSLPEAFAAYQAGDNATHDRLLLAAITEIPDGAILLAQASMARILDRLDPMQRSRILTSPQAAIAKLRKILSA